MNEFKELAKYICIISVLFGIFKSILPTGKYDKYLKTVLGVLFIVLLIQNFRGIVLSLPQMEQDAPENISIDMEQRLKTEVKNHINNELKMVGSQAVCTDVMLVYQNQTYIIDKIEVTTNDPGDDVLQQLIQITNIDEDKIYVSKNS